MHGLRRIILLALILGGLFSFAGLRSSAQPVRADNIATFSCDTGNSSFQICAVTLNVQVGAGGSFSAALVLSGGQILSCGSVPAGIACSHTTTQAVFGCAGGCAAGSRFQIIVSGPNGSANQMAFTIGAGGPLVAAPAYTTSYGGYAPYAGYSSCYGLVLVGCAGASSYSYSSCGLYTSYFCSSPFTNGCVTSITNVPTCNSSCFFTFSFCNSSCLGFTVAFCPSNCTVGLLCNNSANLFCLTIGASCSSLPSCLQLTLNTTTNTYQYTKTC